MIPPLTSQGDLDVLLLHTKPATNTSPSHASGSEEELKQMMDERKQRRMLSNRESARRSRMRKQQHLDELKAEAAHLRAENNDILTKLNMTSHKYWQIQQENTRLRSYATELTQKLQSLNMTLQWYGLWNGLEFSDTTPELEPDPFPNPLDLKHSYFPQLTTTTEIYQ
eukprot:TRINITY_DN14771_c0_g1_i3.p1 TRINITY_DN14771_c0_g1~~TRINITY_DN14771_c0_g1_i3.p1  ORF type:complete len:168 (+),score=35.63 TRINITY_DN14771_c0_g1_i3:885-1388(+)